MHPAMILTTARLLIPALRPLRHVAREQVSSRASSAWCDDSSILQYSQPAWCNVGSLPLCY